MSSHPASVPRPRPRPRLLALAAAVAAVAALPAAAAAQLPLPVAAHDQLVGSRVRIHPAALEDGPLTGTVETVRDGRIVVRLGWGRERVELPAAGLFRLEVASPRPTLRRNLLVGGALGAVTGAGVYLSWCYADRNVCPREGDPRRITRRPSAALLSAAAGMLIGGGIAYHLTPQRWRHLSVELAPGVDGGVVVGARVGRE
ncbi:MAG TPA: hypothetical protein VGE02_10565 [Gemmatimonadales bacterium]